MIDKPGSYAGQVMYSVDGPPEHIALMRRRLREQVWLKVMEQLKPGQPYTIRLRERSEYMGRPGYPVIDGQWYPNERHECFQVTADIGVVETMQVRMPEWADMPTHYVFTSAVDELTGRIRSKLRRLWRKAAIWQR